LQANPLQSPAQRTRAASVRCDDGNQLLGEGLPRTPWVEAAKAPYDKVEQNWEPANGQVSEMASVVTVDMRRLALALRTDGMMPAAVRHELNQAVLARGLTKLQITQVRKQGGDAHRQTSGARAS
jgi:hypothetical protein